MVARKKKCISRNLEKRTTTTTTTTRFLGLLCNLQAFFFLRNTSILTHYIRLFGKSQVWIDTIRIRVTVTQKTT